MWEGKLNEGMFFHFGTRSNAPGGRVVGLAMEKEDIRWR